MNYQLGILGLIAIVLLVVDRVVRIQPLLNTPLAEEEGFTLNAGTTGRPRGLGLVLPCGSIAQRCPRAATACWFSDLRAAELQAHDRGFF